VNKIRGLLSPLVKNLGIEGALKLVAMRRDWADIVGKPLSLHMWPSNLQNNELLINVDSPVWLQQISFYKTAIIKKLHSFDVRDIRFRLGKIGSEKKLQKPLLDREIRASLDNETVEYIETTISGIKDEELRDGIRKAMEKAFSQRMRLEEKDR
jgi:hypothetical protein